MKTVIEELWYGNVCPNNDSLELTPEVKELMKFISNHHDDLISSFDDKQKEIIEKFDDCYAELTSINEREIFVYAFRLGAKMAVEVMSFKV